MTPEEVYSVIYFMQICNTGVVLVSNGKISCDLIPACSDDDSTIIMNYIYYT